MREKINAFHFKRYKKFIQSRSTTISRNMHVHNHHVIPTSIVKNNNTIALTPREHFIAHKMLIKVFNKNTPEWFKMVKAFGYMIYGHVDINNNAYIVTSRDYEQYQKEHSLAMKFKNPMFDPEVAKRAINNMKKSWTPERRAAHAESRRGKTHSDETKAKLSAMWLGVPKPKTTEQVSKIVKASAMGLFVTPWGEFDSPGQASRAEGNTTGLSRDLINKYCKDPNNPEYSFISYNKVETRGLWKRNT
jgi:hypothetical protein